MITVKIAGLPIGIDNKYNTLDIVTRDYRTDETPLFTVSVTAEEIEKERGIVGEELPDSYYESSIAHRKIAEKLPEYDAFLFHGSVIEVDGSAYVITAQSGVGKTTHTRLWLSEFEGEVQVINGDKPVIRIIDGVAYASGTPWRGKEGYGRNVMRPLRGFAFLERGDENRAEIISDKGNAVIRFMSQIYLPKTSRAMLAKTMTLADKVIKESRLVRLECNMEPEAAHIARAALCENDRSGTL